MLDPSEDLTAAARIRNAALEAFANDGVAATSIRDVAKRAGVSPGLVQHHFTSKDNLKRAVDEYVARVGAAAIGGAAAVGGAAAIGGAAAGDHPDGVVQGIGDRLTDWMRDHRVSLLYTIRSAAEGDESALRIFDRFVEVGDAQLDRLGDQGLLRENLDRRWAALHVIIMNLATALLEPAINRHLDSPLHEPDQLERWNRATTELFRAGLFRTGPSRPPE